MNTKSAIILAVAVIGAAVIIANAKGTPEVHRDDPVVVDSGSGDREPPAGMPTLAQPSPQQLARLERELREARLQIKQLQDQMAAGETPAGEVDREDQGAFEQVRGRFFELGRAYADGTATRAEVAELMKIAGNKQLLGRIVRDLEKHVAENPDDIAARLQLVQVESARVHVAESITERSVIGRNVREQVEQILTRDPENWDARYMKAVGISHSQRTPQGRADAVREFEALISLQESRTAEPRFADTYKQLAGVLLAEKSVDKARAALQAGLARHPDAKELRTMLESLPATR